MKIFWTKNFETYIETAFTVKSYVESNLYRKIAQLLIGLKVLNLNKDFLFLET